MSYLSDFKSAPFDIFNNPPTSTNYVGTATTPSNGYTGTGLNGIPDYSYDSLLGSRWATEDGRILTLVSNAATALVSGVLVQSSAEVTAFQNLAMTVPTAYPATAGAFQVLVTNGGTVLNQNQYAGGYFIVGAGTGIGQTLRIASHQAAAASATFVVTLEDPIQVTLDATSTVTLMDIPYQNVIKTPATTATGGTIGATLYPVPASVAPTYNVTSGALVTAGTPQYFYVVSHGPAGVIADSSAPAIGLPISTSVVTAGTFGTGSLSHSIIGNTLQTSTSAKASLVYLTL